MTTGRRQSGDGDALSQTRHVTGVVLAGGGSTRFGSDKARAVVADWRMIDRVVETLSSVCPDVLVSVGTDAPDYALADVRYVPDSISDGGPLAGIHAALLLAEAPWLLVVACDMPFVTPQALEAILDARSPQVDAVVARDHDGRLHPLLGCYRRELLPALSKYLETGRRSVRAFVSELRATTVEFDAEGPLRNINTPDDLKSSGAIR